ncbi:MAG: hypothetical protein K2P90_02935 [Holosporales bacterium]|nr:hypothetical protein [Holosporales bacterium]
MCYLLPGDFLSAMCTSKTMYWTGENSLSSPLKRKKISLFSRTCPVNQAQNFSIGLRSGE